MTTFRSLNDQFAPLGAAVAPFVERYFAGWAPYKPGWNYEDGCIYSGALALSAATGLRAPFDFVYREVSMRVSPDGDVAGLDIDEFNIDNVKASTALFPLLAESGESRFRLAMDVAFDQLARHPRTAGGNYWHKKIYPHQVWLDGLYMAQPFQVAYARVADRPELIDDTLRQFANVREAMREPRSGLYFHGWDESRAEAWSNPVTGCSASFWGRAMGWYMMALVDCLEVLSDDGAALAAELRETADALLRVRSRDGLWHQVLDQGSRTGNYEEASASLMIAYALMKGARLGVLAESRGAAGAHALERCIARFLTSASLGGICGVAGLGNVPYRDGSYEYYLSEKIVENDPKGVGALFMALAEALRRGL